MLSVTSVDNYLIFAREYPRKRHRRSKVSYEPQINTSPDRQLHGNVNYSARSGQDSVIVAGLALWHAPGGRL